MNFTPVIGLEVHAQVKTKSKMFCGCPANTFGADPNSATCPVCLGLPGALPAPNGKAIEKTVYLARALGCEIAEFSQFERKSYFYPDLPKGFQISQFAYPVGVRGELKGMSIRRVHLEEDTGKLIHQKDSSLVDFNRSGVPLIEIVTEPEFSNPSKVREFLKELRILLVHLEVSDADMEKGSLRLEANVSLKREGEEEIPNYKVELKNINSFAFLEKALRFEIERQRKLLEKGEEIPQQTRGYDSKIAETFPQRVKEEAFDYRYFPEPDIPPLTAKSLQSEGEVRTLKEKRKEFSKMGVPSQYVEVLISDPKLALIFEEVSEDISPEEAANIVVNRRYGDPLQMGAEEIISAYKKEKEKELLPEEKVHSLAEKVMLDNESAVSDYKEGKEAALKFLFGQLMKETKGKIDPRNGREILKEILDASA